MSQPPAKPTVLLSFDVEEHSQIEAARGVINADRWAQWAGRIEPNLDWLLEQLASRGATATFFMLGHVARRRPWLVRWIAEAGHELACHGYAHDRLHRLDPTRLAVDLAAARAAIEDQAGRPVGGYRAPSFSLTRPTAWAVDVIAAAGFDYDSSIQPIAHPSYGVPDAPRWPCRLLGASGRSLIEVPPLSWRCLGRRVPVAGGAYFRVLPLSVTLAGVRAAAKLGHAAAMYFHPWEFDPAQPRLPLSRRQRLRTYLGVRRTRPRFAKLLDRVNGRSYRDGLAALDPATLPEYRLTVEAAEPPADDLPAAFDMLRQEGEPALQPPRLADNRPAKAA